MKHSLRTLRPRRSILILAMLLCMATAPAQTSQRLNAGKASDYGMVYSLPLTAVDIYLQAELTESQPGEFHNYARRHMDIDNAITAGSRTARLVDAVIVPRGIPDPAQQWLAQFKNGSNVFMTLTSDNIPLAINSDTEAHIEMPELPQSTEFGATPLDGDIARQAVTQDMARSSSVSKKAELAAQRIFEIREMRSDILSGQADNMPSDGAAMQLVLDNLAAQEAALTAMFAGTTRSRTVTSKITLTPDSTGLSARTAARLSAVDGLLTPDDLSGEPIEVEITVLEQGSLPVNDKGEIKSFPRGGVAYRIPGRARVDVRFRGNTIASREVAIAQLGVVFGLNPSLFSDKREPWQVIFNHDNGAVLELGPAQLQ